MRLEAMVQMDCDPYWTSRLHSSTYELTGGFLQKYHVHLLCYLQADHAL